MSWYYAGPEAKPVGPVSWEELQARRVNGQVSADTYVIEHTGQPGAVLTWRRYREIFPQSVMPASLPPLPVANPPGLPPPVPSVSVPPPQSLFPSASAVPPPQPTYTPNVFPHAAPHGHYQARQTNACCAWGFGLGIAGFLLSPFCGIGILLAVPALILCILGFAQAQQRREQSGRGLAGAGAVLALLGLMISVGFLAYFVPLIVKEREEAAKQQTSE